MTNYYNKYYHNLLLHLLTNSAKLLQFLFGFLLKLVSIIRLSSFDFLLVGVID